VAGSANVTLTAAEAANRIITLTGALTGSIQVIVPNTPAEYIINNATTGSFNLTVKTAAGSGVMLTQGNQFILYSDAVNVYYLPSIVPPTLLSTLADVSLPSPSEGNILTYNAATGKWEAGPPGVELILREVYTGPGVNAVSFPLIDGIYYYELYKPVAGATSAGFFQLSQDDGSTYPNWGGDLTLTSSFGLLQATFTSFESAPSTSPGAASYAFASDCFAKGSIVQQGDSLRISHQEITNGTGAPNGLITTGVSNISAIGGVNRIRYTSVDEFVAGFFLNVWRLGDAT
jgi:hypothetical protein